MYMDDYSNPILNNYRRSADGGLQSKEIQNEQATVVQEKVVLKELPDVLHGVQISGYTEVRDEDVALEAQQFRVDYATGIVHFHPSANHKDVTISRYFGMGATYFPASRVWLETNEDGEVIKTLGEVSKNYEDIKAVKSSLEGVATTAKGQIAEVRLAQKQAATLLEEQKDQNAKTDANIQSLTRENARAEENTRTIQGMNLEEVVSNSTAAKTAMEQGVARAEEAKTALKAMVEGDVPRVKKSLEEQLVMIQGTDGQGGALKKVTDTLSSIDEKTAIKKEELTQHGRKVSDEVAKEVATSKSQIASATEVAKGEIQSEKTAAIAGVSTAKSEAVTEVSGMIAQTTGLRETSEKATQIQSSLEGTTQKAAGVEKSLREIASAADLTKYVTSETFVTELNKYAAGDNELSDMVEAMWDIAQSVADVKDADKITDVSELDAYVSGLWGDFPEKSSFLHAHTAWRLLGLLVEVADNIDQKLIDFKRFLSVATPSDRSGRTQNLLSINGEGKLDHYHVYDSPGRKGQIPLVHTDIGGRHHVSWKDLPSYEKATSASDGLMSKEDKTQHDAYFEGLEYLKQGYPKTAKEVGKHLGELLEILNVIQKLPVSYANEEDSLSSVVAGTKPLHVVSKEYVEKKLQEVKERQDILGDRVVFSQAKGLPGQIAYVADPQGPGKATEVRWGELPKPVDSLTSKETEKALSANQGRILKGLIDAKSELPKGGSVGQVLSKKADGVEWKDVTIPEPVDDLVTVDEKRPLSARQGNVLAFEIKKIHNLFMTEGRQGQVLKKATDGSVAWLEDNNTTYNNATASSSGLMSAEDKKKLDSIPTNGSPGYVLKKTGSGGMAWHPDNNTTYSPATPSSSGLMSAEDKKKLDSIPTGGSPGQVLKKTSSGLAWQTDNNTTYTTATSSSSGLMSAADKKKLDGIATGGMAVSAITSSDWGTLGATEKQAANKIYFVYGG